MNLIFSPLLSSIFVITLLLISNPQANADIITIHEDTTFDSDIVTNEDDTYQINQGITLTIISRFENHGVINNDGILDVRGWGQSENGFIVNYGSIINNSIVNIIHGSINNVGTINNLQEFNNDFIINNYGIMYNSGIITNNSGGDINNKNTFTNDGDVINHCGSEVRGNEIIHNSVIEKCNPPVLTVPESMIKEATESAGAMVYFEVTATDPEDGILAPNCDKESGTMFSMDATIVTCNVDDSDGNFTEGQFSVMVKDTTPPQIHVPSDFTVYTTESHEKIDYPKSTSLDIVEGELEPVCNPSRDHLFSIGENEISCEVSDGSGNTSKASFTLTLKLLSVLPGGNHPPDLFLPGKMTIMATSDNGAEYEFDVTAFDKEDGEIPVFCDYSSGSIFPIGTTTITCSAEDKDGNAVAESFDVVILQPSPPTLISIMAPHDKSIEATSKSTPVSESILGDPIIQGTEDPDPKITHNATSNFPLGTTSIIWSVLDNDGNFDDDVQKITLTDTTKPEIKISYPQDKDEIISDILTINGSSQDKIGLEMVELIINNEKLLTESSRTGEWSFHLSDFDAFEDNHLSIIVKATDTSGNSNKDSVSIIHCKSNQFLHDGQCIDDVSIIHCKSNQFLHDGQCIDDMICPENEISVEGYCIVPDDPFLPKVSWWILFLIIPAGIIVGIITWYKSKSNSGKSNQTKPDYFHPVER